MTDPQTLRTERLANWGQTPATSTPINPKTPISQDGESSPRTARGSAAMSVYSAGSLYS